jgi:hypothetical protein
MVLQYVGDGTIAAVVASDGPLAVAEATEPPTILLVLTIDRKEEWGEGLLGRLLAVRGSGDGDGVEGRMKRGVVRGVKFGPKAVEIDTEAISLVVHNQRFEKGG